MLSLSRLLTWLWAEDVPGNVQAWDETRRVLGRTALGKRPRHGCLPIAGGAFLPICLLEGQGPYISRCRQGIWGEFVLHFDVFIVVLGSGIIGEGQGGPVFAGGQRGRGGLARRERSVDLSCKVADGVANIDEARYCHGYNFSP